MKDTASNTIFNIYLLYPTNRDDSGNFYRALKTYTNIGIELLAYLIDWEKMDYINDNTSFPKSRLYVPADHELFIQYAYKDRLLAKEDISFINCKIIKESDLLILFGSNGSYSNIATELHFVKQEGIPIYTMPDLSPMAIESLNLAIKLIIRAEQ